MTLQRFSVQKGLCTHVGITPLDLGLKKQVQVVSITHMFSVYLNRAGT